MDDNQNKPPPKLMPYCIPDACDVINPSFIFSVLTVGNDHRFGFRPQNYSIMCVEKIKY